METTEITSLIAWYRTHQRQLPWRETREFYPVMVSEFMLQQTTVGAVIPKWREWMKAFPNLHALASASDEDVMRAWSGLGYYQRARRLQAAARKLVELGLPPEQLEELHSLPGFGDYTSAAVGSICFDRPALAIDTNVIRVLFRYYALAEPANSSSAQGFLREKMAHGLHSFSPGDINQALMELGATRCSIKEPSCLLCPLKDGCKGRQAEGGPQQFPVAVAKKPARRTPGVAFLVYRCSNRHLLLVKGTALGLLETLYQPLILFAESPPELKEWAEGLGYLPKHQVSYGISGRRLELNVCRFDLGEQEWSRLTDLLDQLSLEWWSGESVEDPPAPPLSSLTRKVLKKGSETP